MARTPPTVASYPVTWIWPWLLLAILGGTLRAQDGPERLHPFLSQGDLSAGDHAVLARGGVASRMLDTPRTHEIAAFGSVRINAPPSDVALAALDIEHFGRSTNVTALGRFSSPPRLSDLDGLTLEDGDLESLRGCRVDRCGLKLSARMIDRLRASVDWEAPDWKARAADVVRELLLEQVTRYLGTGASSLEDAADGRHRVSAAAETGELLRGTSYLRTAAPELLAHLGPEARPLSDARHVVYWTLERFGYKPTLTVTDLTVYAPDASTSYLLATQVFATHYIESAVSLTVAAAEPPGRPAGTTLLMFLGRSRVDALRGGFPWLARLAAGRQVRRRVEADLLHRKALVERLGAAGPTGHERRIP